MGWYEDAIEEVKRRRREAGLDENTGRPLKQAQVPATGFMGGLQKLLTPPGQPGSWAGGVLGIPPAAPRQAEPQAPPPIRAVAPTISLPQIAGTGINALPQLGQVSPLAKILSQAIEKARQPQVAPQPPSANQAALDALTPEGRAAYDQIMAGNVFGKPPEPGSNAPADVPMAGLSGLGRLAGGGGMPTNLAENIADQRDFEMRQAQAAEENRARKEAEAAEQRAKEEALAWQYAKKDENGQPVQEDYENRLAQIRGEASPHPEIISNTIEPSGKPPVTFADYGPINRDNLGPALDANMPPAYITDANGQSVKNPEYIGTDEAYRRGLAEWLYYLQMSAAAPEMFAGVPEDQKRLIQQVPADTAMGLATELVMKSKVLPVWPEGLKPDAEFLQAAAAEIKDEIDQAIQRIPEGAQFQGEYGTGSLRSQMASNGGLELLRDPGSLKPVFTPTQFMGGIAKRIINLPQVLQAAITNPIAAAAGVPGFEGGVGKALLDAVTLNKVASWTDILQQWGVEPGIANALGLAGDILLDPGSWISFGADTAIGQMAEKFGSLVDSITVIGKDADLARAFEAAIRSGEDALDMIEKAKSVLFKAIGNAPADGLSVKGLMAAQNAVSSLDELAALYPKAQARLGDLAGQALTQTASTKAGKAAAGQLAFLGGKPFWSDMGAFPLIKGEGAYGTLAGLGRKARAAGVGEDVATKFLTGSKLSDYDPAVRNWRPIMEQDIQQMQMETARGWKAAMEGVEDINDPRFFQQGERPNFTRVLSNEFTEVDVPRLAEGVIKKTPTWFETAEKGGQVIAQGSPEEIAAAKEALKEAKTGAKHLDKEIGQLDKRIAYLENNPEEYIDKLADRYGKRAVREAKTGGVLDRTSGNRNLFDRVREEGGIRWPIDPKTKTWAKKLPEEYKGIPRNLWRKDANKSGIDQLADYLGFDGEDHFIGALRGEQQPTGMAGVRMEGQIVEDSAVHLPRTTLKGLREQVYNDAYNEAAEGIERQLGDEVAGLKSVRKTLDAARAGETAGLETAEDALNAALRTIKDIPPEVQKVVADLESVNIGIKQANARVQQRVTGELRNMAAKTEGIPISVQHLDRPALTKLLAEKTGWAEEDIVNKAHEILEATNPNHVADLAELMDLRIQRKAIMDEFKTLTEGLRPAPIETIGLKQGLVKEQLPVVNQYPVTIAPEVKAVIDWAAAKDDKLFEELAAAGFDIKKLATSEGGPVRHFPHRLRTDLVPSGERAAKKMAGKDTKIDIGSGRARKYRLTLEDAINSGVPFEPSLPKAMLAYELEVKTNIVKADSLRSLAEEVGVISEAPVEGYKALELPSYASKIFGDLEGAKMYIPKDLFGDVQDVVTRSWAAASNPQVFWDGFQKVMNFWRATATAWRPGFHVRNFMSNYWNLYLMEGADIFDPYYFNRARDLMSLKTHPELATKTIVTSTGKTISYRELYDAAFTRRILGHGWLGSGEASSSRGIVGLIETLQKSGDKETADFMKEAFSDEAGRLIPRSRTMNPFSPDFSYTRWTREKGSAIEDHAHLIGFIREVEKHGDFDLAAEKVWKFLFDYGDLTAWEQKYAKQFFPFYTWKRKNLPLQLAYMVKQPGKYGMLMDLQRFIERTGGGVTPEMEAARPEQPKGLAAYIPGLKKGGKPLYFRPDLPFQEPFETLNWRSDLSQLNPAIKWGAENIFNENIYMGRPLHNPGDKLGEWLPQYLGNQVPFFQNISDVTNMFEPGKKVGETLPTDLLRVLGGLNVKAVNPAYGERKLLEKSFKQAKTPAPEEQGEYDRLIKRKDELLAVERQARANVEPMDPNAEDELSAVQSRLNEIEEPAMAQIDSWQTLESRKAELAGQKADAQRLGAVFPDYLDRELKILAGKQDRVDKIARSLKNEYGQEYTNNLLDPATLDMMLKLPNGKEWMPLAQRSIGEAVKPGDIEAIQADFQLQLDNMGAEGVEMAYAPILNKIYAKNDNPVIFDVRRMGTDLSGLLNDLVAAGDSRGLEAMLTLLRQRSRQNKEVYGSEDIGPTKSGKHKYAIPPIRFAYERFLQGYDIGELVREATTETPMTTEDIRKQQAQLNAVNESEAQYAGLTGGGGGWGSGGGGPKKVATTVKLAAPKKAPKPKVQSLAGILAQAHKKPRGLAAITLPKLPSGHVNIRRYG